MAGTKIRNTNFNRFLIKGAAVAGLIIIAISPYVLHAANDDTLTVTGINDNSETLYEATFVQSNSFNEVNKIYAKTFGGITTFIRPNFVTQLYNGGDIKADDKNTTTKDTSPILGGIKNEVNSDNVTILGGQKTSVSEKNNNATVLGTNSGSIGEGKTNSVPSILIGGENNKIQGGQSANTILGGEKNEILNDKSNVTILGGEKNEVSTDNTIVAGKNIQNSLAQHSFVFSTNGAFQPQSSNAFYLNTENGLGINTNTTGGGVQSNKAIQVGDINITTTCNSDNIGLMGYFSGCLVGCTTGSAASGNKWNLMDAHTGCMTICEQNSDHCINTDPVEFEPATGLCMGSTGTAHTQRCAGANDFLNKNLDTMFKTELVESCPTTISQTSNPCQYTCVEGASIVDGKCMMDCHFNGKTFKHGETVLGYKHTSETCANQCNSNKNQELLRCEDGTMVINSNSASASEYHFTNCITQPNPEPCSGFNLTKEERDQHLTGNTYTMCTGYNVDGQSCQAYNRYKHSGTCAAGWTYNSTLGYCTKDCSRNGKNDYKLGDQIVGWNSLEVTCTDNSSTCKSKTLTCQEDGSWGVDQNTYPFASCNLIGESCQDHNLDSCPAHGTCSDCTIFTTTSNTQCTKGSTKFKLTSCDTGYTLDLEHNKCQPDCTIFGNPIPYGEGVLAYKKDRTDCAELCSQNSTTLTCGQNGVIQGDTNTYKYPSCITTGSQCATEFNVKQGENNVEGALYNACSGFYTDQISCTPFTSYDLYDCKPLYVYKKDEDTCKKPCKLPRGNQTITEGNVIKHGEHIDAYKKSEETCTDKCSDNHVVFYCDNGTFKSGSMDGDEISNPKDYTSPTCTTNPKICTTYNTSVIKTFIAPVDPRIAHATLTNPNSSTLSHCTPYSYTSSNNMCNMQDTYFYYKCNASTDVNPNYAWNPAGTACTRCEKPTTWNNHTVRNSGTPQPNVIMTGTYNPNSNAACTYHCDNKSDWLPDSNGIYACRGKCTLDGDDYSHGESVTAYIDNKPTCNTECEGTVLTCIEGAWTGGDVETYQYSSCKTQDNVPSHTNTNTIKTLTYTDGNADMLASSFKKRTDYYSKDTYYCRSGTEWIRQECKSGYSRGQDSNGKWKCYKDCSLPRNSTKTVTHGTTETAYKSPTTCDGSNSTCPSETKTCNNGSFGFSAGYDDQACVLWGSNPNNCINTDGWTTTKPNSAAGPYDTCIQYTTTNLQCTTKTNYLPICSPSTSSCNGDYTPSGTNYYKNYTCSLGSKSVSCSCPDGKVWEDGDCVIHSNPLCGNEVYTCALGNVSNKGDDGTNYTWTCAIGDLSNRCSEAMPEPPSEIKVCQYIDESKVYYEIKDGKTATIELPIGSLEYDYHDNCSSNNIPGSCLESTRYTQSFSIPKGMTTSNMFQYDRHITFPHNTGHPSFTNGRTQITDEANNRIYTISDCSSNNSINHCALVPSLPLGSDVLKSEIEEFTIDSIDEDGNPTEPSVQCLCSGSPCTAVQCNVSSIENIGGSIYKVKISSQYNEFTSHYTLSLRIDNGCSETKYIHVRDTLPECTLEVLDGNKDKIIDGRIYRGDIAQFYVNSYDNNGNSVQPSVTCQCDGESCTQTQCKPYIYSDNNRRRIKIISEENADDPYQLTLKIKNGSCNLEETISVEDCPPNTVRSETLRRCVANDQPQCGSPCAKGTPSGTNYYKNYTCSLGSKSVSCSCPDGKVWEDGDCVIHSNPLCGNEVYTCALGNVSNKGDDGTNYTWTCAIGDLGPESCSEPMSTECLTVSSPLACPGSSTATIIESDSTSVSWMCNDDLNSPIAHCACDPVPHTNPTQFYNYTNKSDCLAHKNDHGCEWLEAYNMKLDTTCYTYTCPSGETWNSTSKKCEPKEKCTNPECGSSFGRCSSGNPQNIDNTNKTRECKGGTSSEPCTITCQQTTTTTYSCPSGTHLNTDKTKCIADPFHYCFTCYYGNGQKMKAYHCFDQYWNVLEENEGHTFLSYDEYPGIIDYDKSSKRFLGNGMYKCELGYSDGSSLNTSQIQLVGTNPSEIGWENCSIRKNGDSTSNGYEVDCGESSYTTPTTQTKTNISKKASKLCCGSGGQTISSCFIAGTQVKMADGSYKAIEDIKVGDQLLGNEGTNTVEELYRPLLNQQTLRSINGSKAFVSESHPFMTTEGRKSRNPEASMQLMDEEVTLLEEGDILITENGYEEIVALAASCAPADTQLYNFKVNGDHTYYANGYLVHNKPAQQITEYATACLQKSVKMTINGTTIEFTTPNVSITERGEYKIDRVLRNGNYALPASCCSDGTWIFGTAIFATTNASDSSFTFPSCNPERS